MNEEIDVVVNEQPRYNRSVRNWYPRYILAAFMIAVLLVFGVIGLLYFIDLNFPLVILAFMIALSATPALAIAFLVIRLMKYYKQPTVIDINAVGTIIRLPNGKLQIISPQEIFAFETNDNRIVQTTTVQGTSNISEFDPTYPYSDTASVSGAFPEVFPQVQIPVSVSGPETPAETVLETLRLEQQVAREKSELAEDDLLRQRIDYLVNTMHLSLRSAASEVKLTGRRYERFKRLCKQIGVNTE